MSYEDVDDADCVQWGGISCTHGGPCIRKEIADSKRSITERTREMVERIRSLPVRTEILNVDTGETGVQNIELPLALRDSIIAALEATATDVGEVERLKLVARRVIDLAGNEGVATGSSGRVRWGEAIRELRAALTGDSAKEQSNGQ
jgi:hypothetical protein